MELTVFDHIIVAALVLVLPVLSVADYRRCRVQLEAGHRSARVILYWTWISWSWAFTVAVGVLWLVFSRSLTQLGLGIGTGTGFWIGLVTTVVASAVLIVQPIALRRDPEKLRATGLQFEGLATLLPHSDREASAFVALSITVGICEEVLYRGYLMVYVSSVLAIEYAWPAVLLSSLAFGLAHAYQGPKGMMRTGVFGLAMAGLYLLTGSIWCAIVFHTVLDLAYGTIGRDSLRALHAPPGGAGGSR